MKSTSLTHIDGERYYLTCDCVSPDHLIAFDFFPDVPVVDGEYPAADGMNSDICGIYFVAKWNPSFWKRLEKAFKYLFKKESNIIDDIMISTSNYPEFQEIADVMKRCYENSQKARKC